MTSASQWAADLRTEKRQAYDPHPVADWFADDDPDDSDEYGNEGGED